VSVRYRLTWRQILVPGVVALLVPGARAFGDGARVAPAVTALLVIVAMAALRRAESVADERGVTVTMPLGRRRYEWSGVAGVDHPRVLGQRAVRLTVEGRRFRVWLPAPRHTPLVSPDPGFEEKAATIERLWRESRAAT
jgi:hypothetical protein